MQKIKTIFPVIIILTVAVISRLVYILFQPITIITPDSLGYFAYGSRLARLFSLNEFISQFRTPVYPVIISLLINLNGFKNISANSSEFSVIIGQITWLQTVFGVISTILMYIILRKINLGKTAGGIVSVIYAANYLIIPWERTLLTESLSVFIIILLSLVFIRIINRTKPSDYIILYIISIIMILLRPALLLVPVIIIGSTLLYRRNRLKIILGSAFMLFYFAVPALWSLYNYQYHGYKGFQVYGDLALLGRILILHLPVDAGRGETYFYNNMNDYRHINGELNPFMFLDHYNPNIYADSGKLNQLSVFTRKIILANLPAYITGSLRDVPISTVDISRYISLTQDVNFPRSLIGRLQQVYADIQGILFLITFLSAIYLMTKFKNLTKRPELFIIFVFSFTAIINIMFNVMVDYEDFGRINTPMIPLIYITSGWALSFLIGKIKIPRP